MADAYIELAAIPVAPDATQMSFPAHLRRSTKSLNKVSVTPVAAYDPRRTIVATLSHSATC